MSRTKQDFVKKPPELYHQSLPRGLTITVRAAPGNKSLALVQCGPLVFRAAIGRSGRTALKREGDGATPIAHMKLLGGYIRGDRIRAARSAVPLKHISANMLWCDASNHAAYNRPVKTPFTASHETLARNDNLYDICLVLDWNITSRRRNRGSAIFFHLAKPGYEPTAGCVALARGDMMRLLPYLKKGTILRVL